jgi:hypothetical protein
MTAFASLRFGGRVRVVTMCVALIAASLGAASPAGAASPPLPLPLPGLPGVGTLPGLPGVGLPGLTGVLGSGLGLLSNACYPNQYTIAPGTTAGKSFGWTRFPNGNIEHTSFSQEIGGKLLWSASLAVTGSNGGDAQVQSSAGAMSGLISATIIWDNGLVTTFITRCAAEVSTDSQGGMEMETEGWVFGFPGVQPMLLPAIGTLTVSPPGGEQDYLAVAFSIDFGTTCFPDRGTYQNDELKVTNEESTSTSGIVLAKHAAAGRWGFPSGITPETCADTEEALA